MGKSSYMVLEATRNYQGDRFPVKIGERKIIRYGLTTRPGFIPRIVNQVRAGEQIIWGGATVLSDGYRVLFDGVGPLPLQ